MLLVPARTPLPSLGPAGFTIMSFNVLIPNSVDGWWTYKYYGPGETDSCWAARCPLLQQRILGCSADIVMLQECSPESFADDWAFLIEAGYDCAMLAKGRMRPATFWRKDRFALCTSSSTAKGADGVLHGDRCLMTVLRALDSAGEPLPREPLCAINVHLTAGPNARRRLQQVHGALDSVRKLRKEATGPAAVVVAGDFNSQGRSAVHELLVHGEVLPTFRESGDPTEPLQGESEVTSKPKRQELGGFADAMAQAYGGEEAAPPTIIAAQLQPAMQEADGGPSAQLLAALDESFATLSSDGAQLSDAEEEKWLLGVNQQLGRGSEYRAAVAAREAHGGSPLTRDDFRGIYAAEVAQGKFWGVEHDLRVLRGSGLRAEGSAPFSARFDHIYFSSAALRLGAAQPALPEEEMARLLSGREYGLPSENEASDHLPVATALEWA